MMTLRHTCVAAILTMALAVSVLGGEIDCPAAIPLPPTGTTSTSITTTVILTVVSLIH